MIVDDNRNNLYVLRSIINESLDADIIEANSGQECLRLLMNTQPDLIIMDVQMPEMDGFETSKLIKSRRTTKDIPIVFLTAEYTSDEFRKKGIDLGAIDYLRKPIDDYELLARIKTYLSLSEKGYLAGYFNDLNKKLKDNEEKLLRMNRELKLEKEKAQKANDMKSIFLSKISHELRTPLNSIIGFTNRIIKKASQLLPEVHRENLNIINKESYMLLSHIDNILNISKIESGKMDIFVEEFSLFELINEIERMMNILKNDKDINIIKEVFTSLPVLIRTDRSKLKQILINLAGNAVKFTLRGTIRITLEIIGEAYCIKFIDEGIGIEKDKQKLLFDDFYNKTFSADENEINSGLGLSIAKYFVETLKGAIQCESIIGEGTCFTVYLPFDYEKKEKKE
jgi:two-component system sensor histidine kinase/response regulator